MKGKCCDQIKLLDTLKSNIFQNVISGEMLRPDKVTWQNTLKSNIFQNVIQVPDKGIWRVYLCESFIKA